jgi:hypothetical protein
VTHFFWNAFYKELTNKRNTIFIESKKNEMMICKTILFYPFYLASVIHDNIKSFEFPAELFQYFGH